MNSHAKAVSAGLCAIAFLTTSVMAQDRVPPHPVKAAPTAPLTEPTVTATVSKPYPVSAWRPVKPPVITAVAPKGRVPVRHRGDAALNPQPIPPGHPGPGDPTHQ